MKLLDGGRAPNPGRVHFVLVEEGASLPLEPVNLSRDGHDGEAYAPPDPFRRVTLPNDGAAIAICGDVENTHPTSSFDGTELREQALIEIAQGRLELHPASAIAAAGGVGRGSPAARGLRGRPSAEA
ncbi:MAG TPA: hypothetical protein VEA41_16065 [Salinarimonas sp.]|nr:hypothetical protein [Salinarimonas sp.]